MHKLGEFQVSDVVLTFCTQVNTKYAWLMLLVEIVKDTTIIVREETFKGAIYDNLLSFILFRLFFRADIQFSLFSPPNIERWWYSEPVHE